MAAGSWIPALVTQAAPSIWWRRSRIRAAVALGCVAILGGVLRAQVVISEVMALNRTSLLDIDGNPSDWIEIFNAGPRQADLQGFHLTDDLQRPSQWRFPDATIPPRGFLVVFCSGKDRNNPSGELHTNFRLAREAGEVALVAPDGMRVVSHHRYGDQFPDISHGLSWHGETELLVAGDAEGHFSVPQRSLEDAWRYPDFDGASWQAGRSGFGWGAGHAASTAIGTHLTRDVGEEPTSFYIRMPFTVRDPGQWHHLVLSMQSLGGFVVWLNGHEIARRRAPPSLSTEQRATSRPPGSPRAIAEVFQVPNPESRLRPGANLLAIQGLVTTPFVTNALFRPELVGFVLDRAPVGSLRSFATPTPGGPNGPGLGGVSAMPKLSVQHAWLTDPVTVTVSVASAERGAVTIHYTIDGTEPTPRSPVVERPIELTSTTLLKARTFEADRVPSPTAIGTYVAHDPALEGFSSNLPLAVLSSFGAEVHDQSLATASLHLFEPGEDGRARLGSVPTFGGRIGVKTRGSSTLGRMKKAYTIEIRDEEGEDRDVSLLGMPADSDWILYGPYDFDRAQIRNVLTYELSNRMGHYAVRTRFIELFVNPDRRPLTDSDYVGLYVLMEKIKRGEHRVDVQKLRPGNVAESASVGGFIVKIDRPGPGEQGFVGGGQDLQYEYPKEREITDPQRVLLRDYFDRLGAVLNGESFADEEVGYPRFIDVDSFIDYHLLNEYTKNPDSYTLSTFMFLRRGEKLRMGPQWDFDRAMRTNEEPTWVGRAADPTGWTNDGYYSWWGILFRDPAFRLRYRVRGRELLAGELRVDRVHNLIDQLATTVTEAMERNQRRWPIGAMGSWENDIEALKEWIRQRTLWLQAELLEIPEFSSDQDALPATLEMHHGNDSGRIYYTLDGSDPMLDVGKLSPRARLYDGAFGIQRPALVKARVVVDELFSRITAEVVGEAPMPTIAISEIMYNPPGGRNYEYFELVNTGNTPVDLAGVTLTGGISFDFTLAQIGTLPPGDHIVVAFNPRLFASRYDTRDMILTGPYLGRMSNTAGALVLRDALGRVIGEIAYEDSWFPETDGKGRSLVLVDPTGDPALWPVQEGWRPSSGGLGSPGRAETGLRHQR